MASSRSYRVELRNGCGTTLITHVMAYSNYDAMQQAAARNPGYRAPCARMV